jgi:predicted NAD/FAD-dependent oxidoreductase
MRNTSSPLENSRLCLPADTYYHAVNQRLRHGFNTEATPKSAEICIIGGGYSGLNTAYALQLKGFDTVVLEAADIGDGASGRCGGLVLSGFDEPMQDVEGHVDADTALRFFSRTLEAMDILEDRLNTWNPQQKIQKGLSRSPLIKIQPWILMPISATTMRCMAQNGISGQRGKSAVILIQSVITAVYSSPNAFRLTRWLTFIT